MRNALQWISNMRIALLMDLTDNENILVIYLTKKYENCPFNGSHKEMRIGLLVINLTNMRYPIVDLTKYKN